MTLYAFDGASPFDLKAAKANGAIAVTGYVIGRPANLDPITKARVDEIRGLGLGFVPNAELAADFFNWCTLTQAQQMGAATSAACRSLGLPTNGSVAVPASFDFDFTDYEVKYQKLLAYGRGLVGFLPRAYGPQGFLDYITQPGRMPGTKHWLMMSTFNRPYKPSSSSVCMVQQHTPTGAWINSPVSGTDINIVTDPAALHAWWPANSPYGGTIVTPAEIEAVAQRAAILTEQRIVAALKKGGILSDLNTQTEQIKAFVNGGVGAVTAQTLLTAARVEAQGTANGAAIAAVHATAQGVDPAVIQQAAKDGARQGVAGATIQSTITPGA